MKKVGDIMTNEKKMMLLEDILEIDEGSLILDMALDELEEWNSMAHLSFIVLMDGEFRKKVTGKELSQCRKVSDLMAMMC